MGMKGVEIRPWRPGDREAIKQLVREYLQEVEGGAGDFVPDDHNVNAMTDLGLTWAEAGEPSLVACMKGQPVAFTLWGPIVSPLHIRGKILHGIGSYVSPNHRGKRISVLIRERASKLAADLGYDLIDTCAFDQRGWRSLQPVGFEVRGYLARKQLKQQTQRAA